MTLDKLDLVEVWPEDLLFHGRFKKVNKKRLIILNPSSIEVAFKISDTLSENIILRPEHGYIQPKDRAVITITVLPFPDNSVPEREDITILLCSAPANKGVNVWSDENLWPEESRYKKLVVKFVVNDVESSIKSSSSSLSVSYESSSDKTTSAVDNRADSDIEFDSEFESEKPSNAVETSEKSDDS